ncbi:MAG: hypothetical protein ABEK50_17480 [bacterium]
MITSRKSSTVSLVLVVAVVLTVFIGGCSLLEPSSGDGSSPAVQTLTELARHYQRGNVQRFVRLVHEDYDDGRSNRADLRYEVSDVLEQYSSIDLTVYGERVTQNEDDTIVHASWNLRWTCTESAPGCSAGDIVLRRGETSFVFTKGKDAYKLIGQRSSKLFGSPSPGSITN